MSIIFIFVSRVKSKPTSHISCAPPSHKHYRVLSLPINYYLLTVPEHILQKKDIKEYGFAVFFLSFLWVLFFTFYTLALTRSLHLNTVDFYWSGFGFGASIRSITRSFISAFFDPLFHSFAESTSFSC
uniref:Uncharacterized protein n=1 Tax=Panagrolaimus sp. PS1159 TaxID=55785 RepID=A0AC35GK38_9BILA